MTDFTTIGRRLPQQDCANKATGQALYCEDLRLPGTLCGAILRSPLPHARILQIDPTRARRLAGVRAVLTAEDTPRIKYGMIVPDELPLAVDRVRFVGDEVAAVVAVDEPTAREALALIQVDYEEMTAVFDPLEAMSPGAPRIHDVDRNVAAHMLISRGNVDEDLASADLIFEDRYQTHAVHQCFLEPVTCLARYDPSGRLTLWAPIQDPFLARMTLAPALGVSPSSIRIVQTCIGGAFGSKRVQKLFSICALAAIKSGRPVLFTNTRAEEFAAGLPRVPMIVDLKTGVKRNGTLIARSTRVTADNGAYCSEGPGILGAALGRLDNLYRFQSVRAEAFLVYTNKTTTGAYRGYGNPQMTFAAESQMDTIAQALGLDPIELRLRNAVRAGDTTIHGYKITTCGLDECIRQAAQRVGWEKKKSNTSFGRGIGIACTIHVSGSRAVRNYNGSTAIVTVQEDGGIVINSGEGELGQGANTVLSQIAAEVLGARPETVRVASLDTDFSPFGFGAWASRVTYAAGNAVKLATEDARRQVLAVAAEKLEARIEDLEARDSKVYVKGSKEKGLTFAQVASLSLFRRAGSPIVAKASFDSTAAGVDPRTRYGNISDAYTFGAHAVEVEVDSETGHVQVVNFVAAHDVGRAINPMLVEGQIEGGIVQGLGYSLAERLAWDNGVQQIDNLSDYCAPTARDVPPIESILVETDDPSGPFGAKAIGEPPVVPVAPAIANAIFDAIGVRIVALPITPEKVFWALRHKSGDSEFNTQA